MSEFDSPDHDYCGTCGRSRPACWCHLGPFQRFVISAAEDCINDAVGQADTHSSDVSPDRDDPWEER